VAFRGEISWKRCEADGRRVQVVARRVSGQWRFFARERRFERWEALAEPPLEDWLELLDAVRRRVARRLLPPQEEARVARTIAERFPETKTPSGLPPW
jgi:hypothetical protein